MGRLGHRRKISVILCQVIIYCLLLTGCGPSGDVRNSENMSEDMQTDGEISRGNAEEAAEGGAGEEYETENSAAGDAEPVEEHRTAGEILEQCEGLVLKSKAVCSLEDLRMLPNLQSLVIDYDTWENAQIEDFTPIGGLSRLMQLYISYPAGEELDFSFLAEMDTITELFLVDCDLKDVTEINEKEETHVSYAIAMDGNRLVRADLSTDECPGDIRFPLTALYYVSYYAYPEKLPAHMSGAEALEYLRDTLEGDWEQVELPYASWQKESYELLKGVELPEFYYVIREIPEDEEQETKKFSEELYYLDLEVEVEEYYHVIRYVGDGGAWNYRIADSTGEIEVTDEW